MPIHRAQSTGPFVKPGPDTLRRMDHSTASPYARALGERMEQLHPALQRYFAGVQDGKVGIGEGVFDRFGTRHWWLWPFLRLARRRGVLVPGMHHDVPFRIENRVEASHAVAARTLSLPSGEWTMRDSMSLTPRGLLVDAVGRPPLVHTGFVVDLDGEALCLRSRAVGITLGRVRLRVPRLLAPRVHLTERYDVTRHRQHVNLTIDAPVLGRIYEYAGAFTYRIEEDT